MLDIQLALEQGAKQTFPSWLLFLDQQKTFDRVKHGYMIDALKAFRFSPTFYNIIQELYSDQSKDVKWSWRLTVLHW